MKKKYSNRRYYETHPWARTLKRILTRCNTKTEYYYKKGIKNFLTTADLKYLWFRDQAYTLNRPSIDRIDNKEHYTLGNCRYIELIENIRRRKIVSRKRAIRQLTFTGKLIKIWDSQRFANKALGVKCCDICNTCAGRQPTAGGFRWEYVGV